MINLILFLSELLLAISLFLVLFNSIAKSSPDISYTASVLGSSCILWISLESLHIKAKFWAKTLRFFLSHDDRKTVVVMNKHDWVFLLCFHIKQGLLFWLCKYCFQEIRKTRKIQRLEVVLFMYRIRMFLEKSKSSWVNPKMREREQLKYFCTNWKTPLPVGNKLELAWGPVHTSKHLNCSEQTKSV